jgi:hypothetical protein
MAHAKEKFENSFDKAYICLRPSLAILTHLERRLRKLSQTNDLKWSLKVATCELCALPSVIDFYCIMLFL